MSRFSTAKNVVSGLVLWAVFSTRSTAQTTEVFTPEAFFEAVQKFHPIARQSDFLQKRTDAALRGARGNFDPILNSDLSEKQFGGKNYYSTSESYVRLPSWYGLEGYAGYATSGGTNLNPQEKLPADGQVFVGVSLSVLQGFRTDERRTALAKAKNLAFLNENERLATLNDLLFDAGKIYWEWAHANAAIELRRQFLQLSQARFEGVRESARLGDRPTIDTLEAFLQVQERRADLLESEADWQQTTQKIEVFLWRNDAQPQPIAAVARPVSVLLPTVFSENRGDFMSNPAFRQYDFKLRELEIERRLKREKLLPKLDLKYNLLSDGARFSPSDGLAGHKYGIKFSYPIAARTARAEVQLADFKIAETQLQQSLKGQELRQKILFYETELANLDRQADLLATILRGHRTLLQAEQDRFRLGESSIFLLNARENKLLETSLKRIKIAAGQQKARLGRLWAAGALRIN